MARGDARRVLRRAAVSCILVSADATGAMFDPGLMFLWCDGQVDLAARGKASIQGRSGVASGEYAGQTTRGCRWEPGWVNESQERGAEMWRVTGGTVSARWISKHTDGITWIGQCTQGEERTQTESGFTLSNGRFGVAEPVSKLSAYAISTRAWLPPKALPASSLPTQLKEPWL